jgi:hypothetical protein
LGLDAGTRAGGVRASSLVEIRPDMPVDLVLVRLMESERIRYVGWAQLRIDLDDTVRSTILRRCKDHTPHGDPCAPNDWLTPSTRGLRTMSLNASDPSTAFDRSSQLTTM